MSDNFSTTTTTGAQVGYKRSAYMGSYRHDLSEAIRASSAAPYYLDDYSDDAKIDALVSIGCCSVPIQLMNVVIWSWMKRTTQSGLSWRQLQRSISRTILQLLKKHVERLLLNHSEEKLLDNLTSQPSLKSRGPNTELEDLMVRCDDAMPPTNKFEVDALENVLKEAESLNLESKLSPASSGYTNPKILAIEGGSNSGLLVGACINHRPDLFGGALAHVGVMDMLKFQKFTISHAWTFDYGCSDKEAIHGLHMVLGPYVITSHMILYTSSNL
ncbi:unnamed protein product [Lactuca saligna]|uniref:Peptidase S9 prolyl oligopeptidase catalytic domain-containing protein n=1 Tax=Lactuca saligna TaxID=75948 RepID=A0AA36EN40_LACSI|nr:unnamed protein product [Lactuca saligna]